MKSIQTFLEEFNCLPFREKPKILLQAWDKFFAIQHAQPKDSNELFQKLLKDLQIINKEPTECNHLTFFDDNEDHSVQYKEYLENSPKEIAASNSNQEKEKPPQDFDIRQLVRDECCIEVCEEQKQNMENTMLELIEVCRQKEFYCMHDNISLVHAIAPILPNEEPEYSLSRGYEHLNTTLETELDEVIESSVKNLVPIPSEYEVTSDDESECDVPIKDDSSPAFTTFSNPLFDFNDDFTSSDDESLPDEDVPTENFKVYSNPLFDDREINFDEIDSHCFNAKSDLIESLLNQIKEADFDLDEEIHFVKNLLYDNSSLRPPEELNAEITDTIVESLSLSTIPVEDSDSLTDEIDLFLATDE
nr:hypothetical protein [Tanacetum cinerariifolium]